MVIPTDRMGSVMARRPLAEALAVDHGVPEPVLPRVRARPGPPKAWRDPSAHVRTALKEPWYRLVLDLQDAATRATVDFWGRRGVRAAHLPVTTGSISSPSGLGSDSVPVMVELHGERVYLADSMQFLLEYAARLTPNGAYYIMPCFRGESHDETHLNEFFHSEAELVGGLSDVLDTVDAYVSALAASLLELPSLTSALEHTRHLETLAGGSRAPRITFDDVEKFLADVDGAIVRHPAGFRNLTRLGERALVARTGGAAWVTEWDALAVPFYQATIERGHGDVALNADLVLEGPGEVVGAGQRCFSDSALLAAMRRRNVDPTPYGWYLEMKREAPLATSGFGLGLERFLCWALRHDDIRDLQLVPRLLGVPRSF